MERHKDVWTDTWPDHYLAGSWAKKYKDWSKANRKRDPTLTDRFQSRIHTQPSWYPYKDTADNVNCINSLNRLEITSSRKGNKGKKSKKDPKATAKNGDDLKKLTWHRDCDHGEGTSQRSRSTRSKSAKALTRDKKYDGLRYFHNCHHERNCNPVGHFYNLMDPWLCRFCGALDTRQTKHSNCACVADKVGIMVDDPISVLNNEHRAHREIRRAARREANADMRSAEEMAYRMNMAARSGEPIDYRNHMECKVHWPM